MMRVKTLIFLLFILFIKYTSAQDADVIINQSIDSSVDTVYIKDYSHQLSIKFYGVSKSNQLTLFDDFTGKSVLLKPNDQFNMGFGFNYKWLGVDLAFNFPFVNDDAEIFGKTNRLDLQSNIYTRKFAIDFNFQRYSGYYGSNPEVYTPGWDPLSLEYPLRPDVKTTNISGNFFYVFNNDKFSYRAAFIFNERQLKSRGSWIAGAYMGYFTMSSDSTLVPGSLQVDFNPDNNYNSTKFFSAGVSFGYAHIFVIGKKFFISPTFAIGVGPKVRTIGERGDPNYKKGTEGGSKIFARMALGYNGKRTFAGITLVGETVGTGDKDESWLQHSVNNLRIFIGRRFNIK